jgi:flagellin-specific chaperone FliS
MATMQDLTASVQRESDANDAVITMLNGISQQLKDAQAQNDPKAIQTVIDQIDQNTKKLSDAVTANTPAQEVAQPSAQA